MYRVHYCWKCGYDLTKVTGNTCPECGRGPKPAIARPDWKVELASLLKVVRIGLMIYLWFSAFAFLLGMFHLTFMSF